MTSYVTELMLHYYVVFLLNCCSQGEPIGSQPFGYVVPSWPPKGSSSRWFYLTLTVQIVGFSYTNPHFQG